MTKDATQPSNPRVAGFQRGSKISVTIERLFDGGFIVRDERGELSGGRSALFAASTIREALDYVEHVLARIEPRAARQALDQAIGE